MHSSFLISATNSGAGKTTITLALLRALWRRGLSVQPYKCGPDYIDTKYHDLAAGNPSINLDTFLALSEHVKEIFVRNGVGKQVCVIEGVMGLYDGYDKTHGSSSDIAHLLNVPVVLVVNGKAMAHSAAALLSGFKNYRPEVKIIGAIFNHVRTKSHYAHLEEACHEVGIEPLGYIPTFPEIEIPSRHLGLKLDSQYLFDEFANRAADIVEEYIRIDRLLELTAHEEFSPPAIAPEEHQSPLRFAVAKDEAFNFIYHENIEALKRKGEVVFFSPLTDKALPEADLVYLPGGYPELHLPALSANEAMKTAIKAYAERGGKVLAECGGMMYLCRAIVGEDGIRYPMVGIFEGEATMQQMKLSLGYRRFCYNGQQVSGHEFHYSCVVGDEKEPSQAEIFNAKGQAVKTKLVRKKNVLAGYTHIYWGESDVLKLF